MKNDVIYLDYSASTPCDPRVVEAMRPSFDEIYANPASRSHRPGQAAFTALENARESVAASIGAQAASEIVFTSGATEANNLAIIGSARARTDRCRHLVTQATEHPSVIEALHSLEKDGWMLTEIGVDAKGRVRLDELEAAVSGETALVSVMLANNETGTVQEIREIASLVHARGSILHCDAAQAIGKITVNVDDLGVDLLSLSGHKAYGPKGIGALFLRKTTPPRRLASLLHGGGHEGGIRSGTPNLHGAVGLARALEICSAELETEGPRISRLRDRLEASVTAAVEGAIVNGATNQRLPGTSNISFSGIDGNALLASLPDLAVSSGSACTSSHPEASPVLLAMGVPPELARASLRISVGRFSTEDEIDRAASRIGEEIVRLRNLRRRPKA